MSARPDAAASDLELVVRSGDRPGRALRLSPGDVRILGRSAGCDLRLADPGISRRHCRVEHVGDLLRVTDLDSANGTLVDGTSLKEATLGPGGLLTLGGVQLECRPAAAPVLRSNHGGLREDRTATVVRRRVDTRSPGGLEMGANGAADPADAQRARRNLAAAYRVSRLLVQAPDPERVLQAAIDAVLEAIDAERAAVLVPEESTGELRILAARGRGANDPAEISVSGTVARDVLENGVSTLSRDATSDARYQAGHSVILQGIRSVMCAPLATDEGVLGVVYADSRSLAGAFDEDDLEMLALIGNQAGLALHRTRLMAELERFSLDTIRAIVAAIDAKDGYTHRHSERVAALAVRIAGRLGVGDAELETIRLSGLLHDVGKIGVPEAILNKVGKLTPEEFEQMKRHPIHGVNILRHIKSPRFEAILPGVRHHHERWDGSGYPDGLAGHDIPFLGRVLAVADVIDALSSDRSYRSAFPFERAVEMVAEGAAALYDPDLAAAAAELHARGELEPLSQAPWPPTGFGTTGPPAAGGRSGS